MIQQNSQNKSPKKKRYIGGKSEMIEFGNGIFLIILFIILLIRHIWEGGMEQYLIILFFILLMKYTGWSWYFKIILFIILLYYYFKYFKYII